MNNTKRKIDISVWMLFIAAFLIVVFFLWYFFIYVNGQEKVLIQKSFRALYQLEENFKTRYDSYCKVIESTDMKTILSKELLDLNFSRKKKEMKKIFFGLEVLKKADSLNNSYIYFRKGDTLYLNDIRYTAIIKDSKGETEKDSTEEVIFGMNKTDFFQPIQHSDVFEEIAFIKHKSDSNKYESFYSTYQGDIEVNKLDSLTKSYRGISMGTTADTRISGIDYKLFITELKLQNGEIYYVAGLINKDNYVSETRAINYYAALIIVILFVIFLLSIPLFKLKMTSENQELSISDLILSALSLIAGTFFILLVILSILGYSRTKSRVNSSLEDLSDSVGTKFVTEINKISYTLDRFIADSLIIKGIDQSDSLELSDISSPELKDTVYIGFNYPVYRRSDSSIAMTLNGKSNNEHDAALDSIAFIRLDDSTYINQNDWQFVKTKNANLTERNSVTFIRLNYHNYLVRDYLDSVYKEEENTGLNKAPDIRLNDSTFINRDNIQFIKTDDAVYVMIDNVGNYIRLDDSTYKYFKLMFSLDSYGYQNLILSSRIKKSTPDNYSYRKYFSQSGEWELDGKHIMIDFVISSTSGEQLGVVSERSGDYVYVITSRLTSVINTIMPAGYGFCIVDENGDVKFHSDADRMLQENILAETGQPDGLLSAIYSNNAAFFTARYMGEEHSFFVRPVENLPLYLITFYDNSYCDSINIHIIGNTFLSLIFLLIIFTLTIVAAGLSRYKKTELKSGIDIVNFLRPGKYKAEAYKKMIITNIISLLLITISFWLTNAATLIFLVYVYVLIQMAAINYYVLNLDHTKAGKTYFLRYTIFTAFLTIVIYYFAVKVNADIVYLTGFALVLIFTDYMILMDDKRKPGTDRLQSEDKPNPIADYFLRLRTGINDFLEIPKRKKIIDYFNKRCGSKPRYFYCYLFSWLALMIIVPIIFFFILFYNYETELELAHQLYAYAKDEAVRKYDIDKFYHDYIKKSFGIFKEARENEGIYTFKGISRSYDSKELPSDPNSLNSMIDYLKTDLDHLGTERRSLVSETFIDTNGTVTISSHKVFIKYKMRHIHYSAINSKPDSAYVDYSGEADDFEFNNAETVVISLLVFGLILFVVYKLIKFTSNRIFGLDINKTEDFKFLLKCSLDSGNDIFIQSSPIYEKYLEGYANEHSRVLDYKTTGSEKYDSFPKEITRIIIKNMKLDFEDPSADIQKLSAIARMAEEGKYQLIIITGRSIEKMIEICKAKVKSEEYEYLLQSKKKLLGLLESIDRKYEHIYTPLIGIENIDIEVDLEKSLGEAAISPEISGTIKKELSILGIPYNSIKIYAEQIIKYAVRNADSSNLHDMIVLRVQETVKNYYEDLWSDCTNEEKLLLDDISDNLLLNNKNKKVIQTLMAKGFLWKKVSIKIVNESFRNFVNTKAGGEEGKEYLEVRKTGNWTRYRAPLILILFAVAFFIVLQENLLSNIYSILTIVLGIMTIVTRMSGILSTTSLFKHSSGEVG